MRRLFIEKYITKTVKSSIVFIRKRLLFFFGSWLARFIIGTIHVDSVIIIMDRESSIIFSEKV